MKKFTFSLQALYDYKLTLEKLQKAELSRAEAALRELYAMMQALEDAFERGKQTLDKALSTNTAVLEALAEHDVFFRYLSDEKEILVPKIEEAEEVRDKCRQQLITTMKELKAYNKFREKQYQEYLKEVQLEEEKEMGDLVSFRTISGDETQSEEYDTTNPADNKE